ncbi:hypothetical protein NKI50_27605 [Mesorhizobium sp. M0563]|uniref:hypothetical protein n=1 Tax=Mesorhizobium sp. M0563 TaxID=2956959 RepID=UPI00333A57FE
MAKNSDPEADMQKLTTRMVQLNRQFDELFGRCFERPDLAYEKWQKSALNDAHSYELLKNHLFSLGEMPRDETRKEHAIDASLQLPAIFKEYRGLRDKLDELRTVDPVRFDGLQGQMRADSEPWWVTRKAGAADSNQHQHERVVDRQWERDR